MASQSKSDNQTVSGHCSSTFLDVSRGQTPTFERFDDGVRILCFVLRPGPAAGVTIQCRLHGSFFKTTAKVNSKVNSQIYEGGVCIAG